MTIVRVDQLLCILTLTAAGTLPLSGLSVSSTAREDVPMSARDNPGAWRPIYTGSTGYHPLPTSSDGYDFGK